MKLLTKEILDKFEKQGYTGDKDPKDIKIILKLFNPVGSQSWYVYEKETDDIYWAFVNLGDPINAECGTISMNEIKSIKVLMGLGIERDMYFGFNHTLQEVIDKVKAGQHV